MTNPPQTSPHEGPEKDPRKRPQPTLLKRFRPKSPAPVKIWGPGIAVVVIGFIVAAFFIEPAPPDHVTIAAGPRDGMYYTFAREYAEVFARNGVTLEVLETAGSIENRRLLADPDSGVSVAILQGGTARDVARDTLKSVASLYLEPLWIFYRHPAPLEQVRDLAGMAIAIGEEQSGCRALAEQILADNGITPETPQTVLLGLGGSEAAEALKNGEVDAAIFVISPTAPVIRDLLAHPDVRLLDMRRSAAYDRSYRYLSEVQLVRGVIDLRTDLPASDVRLIAPAANLVVRADIHSALVPLLIEAAILSHEGGGLLAPPGEFPSTKYVEVPVHDAVRRYFKSGPTFLNRYLPFWAASFLDRMKVMLLPLVTLLFPLVKLAPPVYRWRIRSRIYRWYRVLRALDQRLRERPETTDLEREQRLLRQLERELGEVSVPLSYMEEFYNLRLHIELVSRRLESKLKGHRDEGESSKTDDPASKAPASDPSS